MGDKYELTGETREYKGYTLHRIRALKDFGDVKAGDLGGWIESEGNLSQDGTCWVYDNAQVFGAAKIFDNAEVCDDAVVHCDAVVSGAARICGNAEVYGDAEVYGNAQVCGDAKISGDAEVFGSTTILGDAVVKGDRDYTVIKNFWSSGRWITYTRSNGIWVTGCFHGTGEELIKKAYADSEEKGKCYEAAIRFVEEVEREIGKKEA